MKPTLADKYIKRPLLWDSLVTIIILVTYYLLKYFKCITFSPGADDLNNLLDQLVSSSISIGGFIIAALTIVITFKENMKAKEQSPPATGSGTGAGKPASGVELLFKSHHYKSIVNVFHRAAFIFVGGFLYFCVIEILWDFLKTHSTVATFLLSSGVLIMTFAVIRCLLVLNSVIKLQMGDLITHDENESH